MKVIIKKENLIPILRRVQGVAEKNTTVSILSTILLKATKDKLYVFATNTENFINCFAKAQVLEKGEVCVDAKKMLEIIKNIYDGDLELKRGEEGNWLEIKQKKFSSKIISYNEKEFPEISYNYDKSSFISLKPKMLKEMISKTSYAISNDDSRYYLNGAYFEEVKKNNTSFLRMVSTDGYRLSLIDFNKKEEVEENRGKMNPIIIPKKGVYEIRKLIESYGEEGRINIYIDENKIVLKYNETTLAIKLIDASYPSYWQLIPETHKSKVILNKDLFMDSLQRVSITSNPSSKEVTLTFSDKKMSVESSYSYLGNTIEDVDINYSGEKVKVSFNATYVMDILNVIQTEKIDFIMGENKGQKGRPIILIQPNKDSSYTCIVSPIQM